MSLRNICIVMVIAFLLKNLAAYFQSNLMVAVEQGLVKDLRNDLYRHIHELPLAYFSNERTGNLISRVMNDVPIINSGISATFHTLVMQPLLIVVYLTIAVMLSWKLTLLAFVVFPVALLVISSVGRRVHRESGLIQQKLADLTSVLQETISGVKVVKAFGMEEFENRKFADEGLRLLRTVLRVTRIRNLASPATEFLSAAAGGSHHLVRRDAGAFTGGNEGERVPRLPLCDLPAHASDQGVQQCQQPDPGSHGGGETGLRDSGHGAEYQKRPRAVPVEEFSRRSNSRTSVSSTATAIRSLSTFTSRSKGRSGRDRRTQRRREVDDRGPRPAVLRSDGREHYLDGVDLRQIEIRSLRDQIGIVTQETILFNDTVRNNIAYGLDDCPIERIIDAAKAANAHAFISEMPHGYDSLHR